MLQRDEGFRLCLAAPMGLRVREPLVHRRSAGARRAVVAAVVSGLLWAGGCAERQPGGRRDLRSLHIDVPLTLDEVRAADTAAQAELLRWSRERDELLQEACDPGELAEHTRKPRLADMVTRTATLEEIFSQGETLFDRNFTLREGLGSAVTKLPKPGLSRVENAAALGGPDAMSCRECHGRDGDDGHGELHQRALLDGDGRRVYTATPRVPPHVAGLGLVQGLAAEMTQDLQASISAAKHLAVSTGTPQELELLSKGVSFGSVHIAADGSVDTRGVMGVDVDLIIKPLGWKGVHPTLRSFVRAALPQHMGMEPVPLPHEPAAVGGMRPGEAPTLANVEQRFFMFDKDADGVPGEILEGQLTALATYLALVDAPLVMPPKNPVSLAAWHEGAELFGRVGCATCHVPELPLRSTKWIERATPIDDGYAFDLVSDNQVKPTAQAFDKSRAELSVPLFSDLKRHDMGPGLAERVEAGVPASVFLTRPLWGLAGRRYYLHDGRARTLAAAIALHGGEATAAATAFSQLSTSQQRAMTVFLLSLRRYPQGRLAP